MCAADGSSCVRRWARTPETTDVHWLAGACAITTDPILSAIRTDADLCGPFSLLIIDTNAAFFSGQDENDNVEAGNHARALRSLVILSGAPTVLVTCHPTKNFDPTNLLPRGGGAFLNEMDGNLVALRNPGNPQVEITTHGKWRGPEFEPFSFRLITGASERLKDSKGRLTWTVFAAPMSEGEKAAAEHTSRSRESQLLIAMLARPRASLRDLAEDLEWKTKDNLPNRRLVQTTLNRLKKEKLVEIRRDRWSLTTKGRDEAGRARADDEVM